MKKNNKPTKIQFRDQLIEWSEKNLGVSFSTLDNIQQSRQMIAFFVGEVLEKLYPGIVPDDDGELESCIIDGPGDGGADFLYRTDSGHVLVIQAKYRGQNQSESPESVGRFLDLPQRLYLSSLGKQQSLHKELVELVGQIDWHEDAFHLYYITTAKTTPATNDRVEQGPVSIPEIPDLLDRIEPRYLDFSGLNQELREAQASADFPAKPIRIPMIPDDSGNPWCHYVGGKRDMYIGEVSGAELADILQAHKAALFTMNIRDYVGDSRTNKEIKKTALNDPEDFEYFNNGVTAVAGKITPDPDNSTLVCERLSVINGAQTIRSLLSAVRDKNPPTYKPVSSVRVLIRLMKFKYPSESPFVREVTKYNNTQNAIKISDFRSNDTVQRDISRRFQDINLKGRKYEYLNKRSTKKRNAISITLEELTKSVFAYQQGPDDMYGGTAKLFDASSSGNYTKVFQNPDSALTADEFRSIAGTYFMCNYIKSLWESERRQLRQDKQSMHPALERKGLLYFTVGELERQNYTAQGWDLDHDIRKLAKPNDWLSGGSSDPAQGIQKAFEIARKVLIQRYNAKSKIEGFKHRNWFRDPDTLGDVREGLSLALELGTPPKLWPKS